MLRYKSLLLSAQHFSVQIFSVFCLSPPLVTTYSFLTLDSPHTHTVAG